MNSLDSSQVLFSRTWNEPQNSEYRNKVKKKVPAALWCWWWWQWGLTTKEIFISWTFSNLKIFQFFLFRNSRFLQYFPRKCSVLLFVPVDVIHFVNNLSKNDSFLVQYWRPYHMTTSVNVFFFSVTCYNVHMCIDEWVAGTKVGSTDFLSSNPCQLLYILENFNFNFRHSQKWWLQIWQCPSCPVL